MGWLHIHTFWQTKGFNQWFNVTIITSIHLGSFVLFWFAFCFCKAADFYMFNFYTSVMNEVLLFTSGIPLAPLIQSYQFLSCLITSSVHSFSNNNFSSCLSPAASKSPFFQRARVSGSAGSLTVVSTQERLWAVSRIQTKRWRSTMGPHHSGMDAVQGSNHGTKLWEFKKQWGTNVDNVLRQMA